MKTIKRDIYLTKKQESKIARLMNSSFNHDTDGEKIVIKKILLEDRWLELRIEGQYSITGDWKKKIDVFLLDKSGKELARTKGVCDRADCMIGAVLTFMEEEWDIKTASLNDKMQLMKWDGEDIYKVSTNVLETIFGQEKDSSFVFIKVEDKPETLFLDFKNGTYETAKEREMLSIFNKYSGKNFTAFFSRSDMESSIFLVDAPRMQDYEIIVEDTNTGENKKFQIQAMKKPTGEEVVEYLKEFYPDDYKTIDFMESMYVERIL